MSELATLYTDEILAYAKTIFNEGLLSDPDTGVSAHSKICGSSIHVTLKIHDGAIVAYGQSVKACILGRAAASMVGEVIVGATAAELEVVSSLVRAMLCGSGERPTGRWSGLARFAAAKDVRSRHGSILLVFDALGAALSVRSESCGVI